MELIGILIALSAGIWVGLDAGKRGYSTAACWGWGIGTSLLLIVVLPIYLLSRPKLTAEIGRGPQLCVHCGKYYEECPSFCPNCGANLRKDVGAGVSQDL